MGLLISVQPLRESRPFARLWSANTLTNVSAQMMQMAIAWTIYDETRSSLAVGGVGLAMGLPILVFGLWGGALTDTRSPRALGLIGVSGQMAATVLLLVTSFMPFSLPLLYVLISVQAAFMAITTPTRLPYIRYLLPLSSVPAAMSLYMLSMNMGQIVGPILGGALLGRTAIGVIFAIHALTLLTYLVSVATLPRIKPASQESPGLAAIKQGIRVSWNTRDIRTVFLTDLFAMLVVMPIALLPAFSKEILHGDAATYGWLLAALSTGGLTATVASGWLEGIRRRTRATVIFATTWCGAVAILGLSTSLYAALPVLFAMGALDVWSVIVQQTVVQTTAPDDTLGRIGGVQNVVSMAGPQVGHFRAGFFGSLLGTQIAVIAGAALGGVLIVGSYLLSKGPTSAT